MSVAWSDEKVEELRKLWKEGYSASFIAGIIGKTRNGVIGKVTRLGLPSHMVVNGTRGFKKRIVKPRARKTSNVKPVIRSKHASLNIRLTKDKCVARTKTDLMAMLVQAVRNTVDSE